MTTPDVPAGEVEALDALQRLDRLFTYPVATEINPRGYGIRADNTDGVEFAVEIIRSAIARLSSPARAQTEGAVRVKALELTDQQIKDAWRESMNRDGDFLPAFRAVIAADRALTLAPSPALGSETAGDGEAVIKGIIMDAMEDLRADIHFDIDGKDQAADWAAAKIAALYAHPAAEALSHKGK